MQYARLQMLRRFAIALPTCVALASPTRILAAPPREHSEAPAASEPAPRVDAPTVDDSSVPDADTPGDADAPIDAEAPVEGDADPSTVDDEPPPPRSVFAPTKPPTSHEPVPEAPLAPGIPGGYWDVDKSRGREPDDGEDEILAGSIIFPLGLISVGSSAATVWLSTPGHCESRWQSLGASPDHDQCKGLYAFGWVRLAYGSLMIITGAALLGVGLHRRRKHADWEKGYALRPRFDPFFTRGGAGVSLTLRLGGRRRR